MFVGGGDLPRGRRSVQGGLLGADYAIENGRYRFARVYDGENWNPELRAPLTQPGVERQGRASTCSRSTAASCAPPTTSTASSRTRPASRWCSRSARRRDGKGAREVTVVPVGERGRTCATCAWVEDNRRKVDELTGGRVAYVYLPDTGGRRLHELQPLLLRAGRQARRRSSTSASTAAARSPTTSSTACGGRC